MQTYITARSMAVLDTVSGQRGCAAVKLEYEASCRRCRSASSFVDVCDLSCTLSRIFASILCRTPVPCVYQRLLVLLTAPCEVREYLEAEHA